MAEVDPRAAVETQPPKGARLEDFERSVYLRKKENRIAENDAALREMLQCLSELRHGHGFVGHGRPDVTQMTRFCAAVGALITDPGFNFTMEGFNFLSSQKPVLDTIFRASAYGGAEHLFQMLTKEDPAQATKYLMLLSLNSRIPFDLEPSFRENPQAMIGLYLSLIGYGQVLTKEGHERREALLRMAPIFENVDLPSQLWNELCSAYMHCSYASGEHKHDVKRVFHKIIANGLKALELPAPDAPVSKERPKIVCVFEWWGSKHAMYRSYARSIQQLRKRFHLVGVGVGKSTDAKAKEIFDEWIELDGDKLDIAVVAKTIAEHKPDIMYYPSIGMSIWVMSLASLRIAPLQIMSYGHPATSNSPVIDYGIIESDCLTPECFSERMVGLPPNTVRPSEFEKTSIRHRPRATNRVKIAVSAMQVKVSYPFLKAMQEVQKRAKKEVEFNFFAACTGIGLASMGKDLSEQLQNVWNFEQSDYQGYLKCVSECDLALFSFPFGGANSCYDAITVGIPMVSLKGKEPHSMSDASIITRSGLPQELVTHSVEEYIERIVELVDDDVRRAEIAGRVASVDLEGKFYREDESGTFLKTFERIYEENCARSVAAAGLKAA